MMATHLFRWRKQGKKDKIKKKIENLSSEWEQLTQYQILVEESIYKERQVYDKLWNDLQAKLTQLKQYKDSFDDIKHIMIEVISAEDVKPKEFQSISNEMMEIVVELSRIKQETAQLQQDFDVMFADRESKILEQNDKVVGVKARIQEIERELSTLKLSS